MSWSEATLESYLDDLTVAEQSGRNLLTKITRRMMEQLTPWNMTTSRNLIPLWSRDPPLMERIVRLK